MEVETFIGGVSHLQGMRCRAHSAPYIVRVRYRVQRCKATHRRRRRCRSPSAPGRAPARRIGGPTRQSSSTDPSSTRTARRRRRHTRRSPRWRDNSRNQCLLVKQRISKDIICDKVFETFWKRRYISQTNAGIDHRSTRRSRVEKRVDKKHKPLPKLEINTSARE